MLDRRLVEKSARDCLDIGKFSGVVKYLFQYSLDIKFNYDILLNLYFNEDGIIQVKTGWYYEYIYTESLGKRKMDKEDLDLINNLIKKKIDGYK